VFAWFVAAPATGLPRPLQLLLAAIFVPTAFVLALGQATLLVVGVVALTWWLLKRGHQGWAGVVLSLIVLKPQLAFLVPVALLIAGRRLTFFWFMGASALLAGIALLLLPFDSLVDYAGRLLAAGRDPNLWNVNTTLTIAGERGGVAGLVQEALVLVAGLVAIRRHVAPETRDECALVVGLLTSLLLTPYLHYPDLAVLTIAAWLFLRMRPGGWQRWLPLLCYAAATIEPFGVTLTRPSEILWLACLALLPLARPAFRKAPSTALQGAPAQT
jgi:hypothetical protein